MLIRVERLSVVLQLLLQIRKWFAPRSNIWVTGVLGRTVVDFEYGFRTRRGQSTGHRSHATGQCFTNSESIQNIHKS